MPLLGPSAPAAGTSLFGGAVVAATPPPAMALSQSMSKPATPQPMASGPAMGAFDPGNSILTPAPVPQSASGPATPNTLSAPISSINGVSIPSGETATVSQQVSSRATPNGILNSSGPQTVTLSGPGGTSSLGGHSSSTTVSAPQSTSGAAMPISLGSTTSTSNAPSSSFQSNGAVQVVDSGTLTPPAGAHLVQQGIGSQGGVYEDPTSGKFWFAGNYYAQNPFNEIPTHLLGSAPVNSFSSGQESMSNPTPAPIALSGPPTLLYSQFGQSANITSSGGQSPTYVISGVLPNGQNYSVITTVPYLQNPEFRDMAVDQAYGTFQANPSYLGSVSQRSNASLNINLNTASPSAQLAGGEGYYAYAPTSLGPSPATTGFGAVQVTVPTVINQSTPFSTLYGYGIGYSPAKPQILLPSNWAVDPSGNLTINGNAPTTAQSEAYANALVGATPSLYEQSQSPQAASGSQGPQVDLSQTNWYQALEGSPSLAPYLADLATIGIVPTITQPKAPSAIQPGFNAANNAAISGSSLPFSGGAVPFSLQNGSTQTGTSRQTGVQSGTQVTGYLPQPLSMQLSDLNSSNLQNISFQTYLNSLPNTPFNNAIKSIYGVEGNIKSGLESFANTVSNPLSSATAIPTELSNYNQNFVNNIPNPIVRAFAGALPYAPLLAASAAAAPEAALQGAIGFGGFSGLFNTAGNLFSGHPIAQNLGNSVLSGAEFGVIAGPLFEGASAVAGLAAKSIYPLPEISAGLKNAADAILKLPPVAVFNLEKIGPALLNEPYLKQLYLIGRNAALSSGLGNVYSYATTGEPATPQQNLQYAAAGGALPLVLPVVDTAIGAANTAFKTGITGTPIGDLLNINAQRLDMPAYPQPLDVQATGNPASRLQYVRGYVTQDGTVVPGYYREYASNVGAQARQSPFLLSYSNRNPVSPNLDINDLMANIRAAEKLPKGFAYHLTPYDQNFAKDIASGAVEVNPDVATGQSLAPGVTPFVDANGDVKFEITSEGRGSYMGRSRGLYQSNPIVQDFTNKIVNQVVKPIVEYDANGNPINVNVGYGAYGFGGSEEGATKSVLENPSRAIALRTATSTAMPDTGIQTLLSFNQFADQTGRSLQDLQNNYQLVKDEYEAYLANRGAQGLALENVKNAYGENQRITAPHTILNTLPESTQELIFRAPEQGFYNGIPLLEKAFAPYRSLFVTNYEPGGFLPIQRNFAMSPSADYLRQRGTLIPVTEKGIALVLEDNGKYGLPGGFVSPTQENIAIGTAREVAEETGFVPSNLKPEFSYLGAPEKFFQTPNQFQNDYQVFSTKVPSSALNLENDIHGELHGITYWEPGTPLPDNINADAKAILERYASPEQYRDMQQIPAEKLTYEPPYLQPQQTTLEEAIASRSPSFKSSIENGAIPLASESSVFSSSRRPFYGVSSSSLASGRPSISPTSVYPSFRISSTESTTPSTSPSISPSQVTSPSPSIPFSATVSPSISFSPSVSPSPYLSPYLSPSPYESPQVSQYPYYVEPIKKAPPPSILLNNANPQPFPLTEPSTQQRVGVETEYSPSIVTSLFPNFQNGGITDTSSPILGIAVRNPLNAQVSPDMATGQSQAASTPASLSAQASPTSLSLDAATIGTPTANDLALEQAYLQALGNQVNPPSVIASHPTSMTATTSPAMSMGSGSSIGPAPIPLSSASAQPISFNPNSPAAYMNTSPYYSELSRVLMQQQLANMQNDVIRNYINSLYGNSIQQNLGGSLSRQQLMALIASQQNMASQQYNRAAAPIAFSYVPSDYANINPNANALKKSLPQLKQALSPEENIAFA